MTAAPRRRPQLQPFYPPRTYRAIDIAEDGHPYRLRRDRLIAAIIVGGVIGLMAAATWLRWFS